MTTTVACVAVGAAALTGLRAAGIAVAEAYAQLMEGHPAPCPATRA